MHSAAEIIGLVALILMALPARAIDTQAAFTDPQLQERYLNLTQELRCLVCQNQTIGDSNADLAGDLRRQVREMIAAQRTDAEILKFMTDRYGDFVLYKPPVEPRTWLLWTAPAIFLVLGLTGAALVIRRKSQGIRADGLDDDSNDDLNDGATHGLDGDSNNGPNAQRSNASAPLTPESRR